MSFLFERVILVQNNLQDKLDFHSLRSNLLEMSDIDRWQSGEKVSEYYYLYMENCIDISARAYELYEEMGGFYKDWLLFHFSRDRDKAWNAAVGTMAWIDYDTFCDCYGHDPMLRDPYEYRYEQERQHKKLSRLTKQDLMELMTWVTGTLMQYMEIRAAYDAIYSVLTELESNNSMLRDGNTLHLPDAGGVI